MKILLCKSHFAGPVSGSDETFVTYATHLNRAGHQLTVVLLHPPGRADQYYARLRRSGVEVASITRTSPLRRALRRLQELARRVLESPRILAGPRARCRIIWQRVSQWLSALYFQQCLDFFRQHPADLIHLMTPDPGGAVMIRAGHAAGIPVLYQELGTPHYLPELEIHYDWFHKVLPLCSEVAALSPRLSRQWADRLLDQQRVSVLPLLVEDARRAHPPRRGASGGVTFGFAARMEGGKGPLSLVEAFAIVRRESADSRLTMAGTGPQERQVRARARARGLDGSCTFPGAYVSPREKSDFMRGLDVFVLPTLAEGTPNSIIEAMAHGLPIIASGVGGIPDIVTPETGILVPPDDTAALAGAMRALASSPELRARMGLAARARYEELFSSAAVLPMLVAAYRRTAARGRHVGAHAHAAHAPTHPWHDCLEAVS